MDYVQGTAITIKQNHAETKVIAVYFPPKHNLKQDEYQKLRYQLGSKFTMGGDFNAKNEAWGSHPVRTSSNAAHIKGKELLKAMRATNCNCISANEPTYWPTDRRKKPDVIDFFIVKGIASSYIQIENIIDLTSDHTLLLLSLSTTIMKKYEKRALTSKYTNWDGFREVLDEHIKLKVSLKCPDEIDAQCEIIMEAIQKAAAAAMPERVNTTYQETTYPLEVRILIAKRRRVRRVWHHTQNPSDKNAFNRINNQLNRLIKRIKRESFATYLENLSPHEEKDYSLWKATRKIKRTSAKMPPLKDGDNYARRDEEKVELVAKPLGMVIQPHDLQSNIDPVVTYKDDETIKPVSPKEIANEIVRMNPKKAPGFHQISTIILKELSKKSSSSTHLYI